MSNHVHLIAVPERPDGLALALGQLHGAYAQRFNRRYRRTGHLWQNRFYSCPLGPSHLWRALMYVDLNPVRAGMLSDPTAVPLVERGCPYRQPRRCRPAGLVPC